VTEVEPAFLLDTNILAYLISGSSPVLRTRVEDQEPGRLVTSTLCVAEAVFGLRDDPAARSSLDRLLGVIKPVAFTLEAALGFPEVPFRRGKLDRFIAAHALALDLTLVTNNEADFRDVPRLRIENWTRAS
jgi:tRNA(fMet)-specific endonuclease VapC